MAYGTIKIDTITFTDGGVDKSVSISGLVQNPTFSGDITVTGTVSGNTIRGQTVSGVTVTGTTALFSTGTFISLTGTTSQGTTATYTSGSFTSLTGVTTAGTTANFVSGVFSTQISGATVTGNAGAFTTLTGGVTTVTSGVFAAGSASNPSISFTSDPNTGIYSPGADQVALATGGTGRLFIDASGRVGVGTTPSTLLHIQSTDPAFRFKRSDAGTDAYGELTTDTSGLVTIKCDPANAAAGSGFRVTVDNSEMLRVDSSGRLLVGTSSAQSGTRSQYSKFTVQGNNQSTGDGAQINLANNTNAPSLNTGDTLGQVIFTDNGPGEYGKIACQMDGAGAGTNDYPGRLVFSTTADGASSPTERMRIGNGGLTSIGGVYTFTTGNAANVNVDSSGLLQRSTSSIKYKTDVETLDDQYADALLACRPVWYRSTCEHDCSEHSYWGFIAEEVASIDPRLVHWKTTEITHDENGAAVSTPCTPEPEGVQYERFVPHLLNLIKRQKEQIEAMEARLTALESA